MLLSSCLQKKKKEQMDVFKVSFRENDDKEK